MVATKQDTSLAIAPINSSDHVNSASGSHALALAIITRQKLTIITNKCEQSAMITPQNRGPRIGSPTSQMSKMT